MAVVLVGLSHKTAPLEIRERLAVPSHRLKPVLSDLKSIAGIEESVLLSTCNRTEIYARPNELNRKTVDSLYDYFKRLYGMPKLDRCLYQRESFEAIKHLFRVASGLDSLVVGESEVLGQVKSAYQFAHGLGTTGKITNVMFQRALFVGKQVRTQTDISEGSSSVGSIAVQLAGRIFGELKDHRVVLLGAGEIAEVTARSLMSQKAGQLVILNRTEKKAKDLALLLNGHGRSLDHLEEELLKADIVICSTGAQEPFISSALIEGIMNRRRQRTLYFIDIAVPRNVHPEVHQLDNVFVYNIDDLEQIVKETLSRRNQAIEQAEQIVRILAHEFQDWISGTLQGQHMALRHYPHKG